MSRGVLGAAAGAGAATAYLRPDVVAGYVFDKWDMFPSRGPGSDYKREIDELTKLVQQLSRDVSHGRQGITVIHHGGERAGYATYAIGTVGLGTLLYLRVVKGWKLTDMLYVTRRHLSKGLGAVNERIEGLQGRLLDVRNKLQAKLAEVIGKQNDTIQAQRRLAEHLERVGKEVETTGSQVRQIHGLVFDMDASLNEVGNSQRHTNHGIYILCKAVGELMAGHNLRSKAELLEFTRSPAWQQGEELGIGGLLRRRGEGGDARAPFLLGSQSLPEPAKVTDADRAFTSFEEESVADDFPASSRSTADQEAQTAIPFAPTPAASAGRPKGFFSRNW